MHAMRLLTVLMPLIVLGLGLLALLVVMTKRRPKAGRHQRWMICRADACRHVNRAEADYCSNCGEPLNK